MTYVMTYEHDISLYIIEICNGDISLRYVMVICHGDMSCSNIATKNILVYVIVICHPYISFICNTDISWISWSCVMVICHGDMSYVYIIVIHH